MSKMSAEWTVYTRDGGEYRGESWEDRDRFIMLQDFKRVEGKLSWHPAYLIPFSEVLRIEKGKEPTEPEPETKPQAEVDPEPEIEVGNVVKYKDNGTCEGKPDCIVIGSCGYGYALQSIENKCCVCNTAAPADLTFIRKGPKRHVFERVRIQEINAVTAPTFPLNGAIAYQGLAGNGKTYTMTLEEVE